MNSMAVSLKIIECFSYKHMNLAKCISFRVASLNRFMVLKQSDLDITVRIVGAYCRRLLIFLGIFGMLAVSGILTVYNPTNVMVN